MKEPKLDSISNNQKYPRNKEIPIDQQKTGSINNIRQTSVAGNGILTNSKQAGALIQGASLPFIYMNTFIWALRRRYAAPATYTFARRSKLQSYKEIGWITVAPVADAAGKGDVKITFMQICVWKLFSFRSVLIGKQRHRLELYVG